MCRLAQQLSSPAPAHRVRLSMHPPSPMAQQAPSSRGPPAALLTWQRKRNWWYFQRKLRSYAPGEPPCLLLQKQHKPWFSIPACPGASCLSPAASSPARQEEDLWGTARLHQNRMRGPKPTTQSLCNKADQLPPLSIRTTRRHKLRTGSSSPSSQCAARLQSEEHSPKMLTQTRIQGAGP